MKQFNEEYKAYLNEEAPNLWERIEAGLEAKAGADTQTPEVIGLEKARQRRGKSARIIRLAASVAACAAALILIIPVYRLVSGNRLGVRDGAPAQMEDMSSTAVARNTVTTGKATEAADGAAIEDADDAVLLADAGVTEIEYRAETAEEKEAAQESQAAEETARGDETEESMGVVGAVVAIEAETDAEAQAESADSNAIEDLLQGAADSLVSVRVMNVLSDERQEAAVYEIEVLQDHESGLKAAQRLTVTADALLPPLTSGAAYELALEQIDLVNMTAVLKKIDER